MLYKIKTFKILCLCSNPALTLYYSKWCFFSDICPKNEEYVYCVNPCNDCETKGQCEFLACTEGCDCKIGFYRDASGSCIPENQCPVKRRFIKSFHTLFMHVRVLKSGEFVLDGLEYP